MDIRNLAQRIQYETEKIIIGKSDKVRLIVMAILSGGHVLLDDLPGVGKTTMVKAVSKALGLSHSRIQFVPDLLPSDILGMQIYDQKTGDFILRQGPVMTNVLLADEINRAIPRTQSALLEAMEEGQVSIDNTILLLPQPFLVLATQNPVESESTFKLPAAQMDRFLIRISVGYPKPEEEREMLFRLGDSIPMDSVVAVTDAEELLAARKEISKVYVSDVVADYIIAIAEATRTHSQLKMGISPRGSRSLYRAAKVWAAMEGRDFVTPDDVKTLAPAVLTHRLLLKSNVKMSGTSEEMLLDEILNTVTCQADAKRTCHEV